MKGKLFGTCAPSTVYMYNTKTGTLIEKLESFKAAAELIGIKSSSLISKIVLTMNGYRQTGGRRFSTVVGKGRYEGLEVSFMDRLVNKEDFIDNITKLSNIPLNNVEMYPGRFHRTHATVVDKKNNSFDGVNMKLLKALEEQNIITINRGPATESLFTDHENNVFVRDVKSVNGNVLAFSCTHFPFVHPEFLAFLKDVQKRFKCENVVCLGDMFDHSSMGKYGVSPEGFTSRMEYMSTMSMIEEWFEAFPNLDLTLGNHDVRPFKTASRDNISSTFMQKISTVYNFPRGWRVCFRIEIDGVVYTHGDGNSGEYHAINLAKKNRRSTVGGHVHSSGGVWYLDDMDSSIFGMNVGCGISDDAFSFAYNKMQPKRPIIGCGVVLDHGRHGIFVKK